jgi:DNA-binding HxlR family transcriptional regulator
MESTVKPYTRAALLTYLAHRRVARFRAMSRDLGISEGSLNTALKRLVSDGLVEVELVYETSACRATRYRLSLLGEQAAASALNIIEQHAA